MMRRAHGRPFYRRILLPLLVAKVLLSFVIKEERGCDDDVLAPVKVFYASALSSNILGKRRSVWLFKGVSLSTKLNRNYRLLTALRLLLLIAAGDIETNPGPIEIDSFPEGVPVVNDSILTAYPCLKCGDNAHEDCVQCEYCMRWEHNHCSNLTRSMSVQIAKYANLVYLCDDCVAVGVMPMLRRICSKLKSRAITLGKLLDFYDSRQALPTPTSIMTQTETADSSTLSLPTDQPNESSVADEPEVDRSVLEVVDRQLEPVIVKGQQDPRSNFYRFDFTYGHVKYKSLEHAYQSIKASMCGYAALAWDIRKARSPQEAKRLAEKLPRLATKKLHDLMFDLLKSKVSQCYSFRQSLRNTGSRKIFHSTYRNVDLYWCTGLDYRDVDGHLGDYEGLNVFGQMLQETRDGYLLAEENYETRTQCWEAGDFVVIVHDGEDFIRDQDFYYRGSGYHRYHR
jgi:ribA/ribD-fused uncharacterized protein